jgi:glucokinase
MAKEKKQWAIGVDLGGTKVEVALVDDDGAILERLRHPTPVSEGYDAVIKAIIDLIQRLRSKAPDSAPAGVGIGVAGQVEAASGLVRFAPNLKWHDVPLGEDLQRELELPVKVLNDVRAVTLGEWQHGAGRDCDDLICIFVGTGIGGGIVSGGRLLTGCTNTAGEVGHMTIALNGPECSCGNRGCVEALAGGWGIARRAQEAIAADPEAGASLLIAAAGLTPDGPLMEKINARVVAESAHEGDPLAQKLMREAADALVAGTVSLVNAFNPCRLILGGGVIEGSPELIDQVKEGIEQYALAAARAKLQVLPAKLHNDSGVIGAAAYAILTSS